MLDTENNQGLLIDGNERAQALHYAVLDGVIGSDHQIRLITGDLHRAVVFLAKAIAPLWR